MQTKSTDTHVPMLICAIVQINTTTAEGGVVEPGDWGGVVFCHQDGSLVLEMPGLEYQTVTLPQSDLSGLDTVPPLQPGPVCPWGWRYAYEEYPEQFPPVRGKEATRPPPLPPRYDMRHGNDADQPGVATVQQAGDLIELLRASGWSHDGINSLAILLLSIAAASYVRGSPRLTKGYLDRNVIPLLRSTSKRIATVSAPGLNSSTPVGHA
jgi:hypothetical protein